MGRGWSRRHLGNFTDCGTQSDSWWFRIGNSEVDRLLLGMIFIASRFNPCSPSSYINLGNVWIWKIANGTWRSCILSPLQQLKNNIQNRQIYREKGLENLVNCVSVLCFSFSITDRTQLATSYLMTVGVTVPQKGCFMVSKALPAIINVINLPTWSHYCIVGTW